MKKYTAKNYIIFLLTLVCCFFTIYFRNAYFEVLAWVQAIIWYFLLVEKTNELELINKKKHEKGGIVEETKKEFYICEQCSIKNEEQYIQEPIYPNPIQGLGYSVKDFFEGKIQLVSNTFRSKSDIEFSLFAQSVKEYGFTFRLGHYGNYFIINKDTKEVVSCIVPPNHKIPTVVLEDILNIFY